jgi:hypothetical protein
VDWDLIFARRFLNNLHFRRKPTKAESYPIISNASSAPVLESDGLEPEWEFLPRQPEMQVDGLVRFARTIRWPNVDRIESTLRSKLDRARQIAQDLSALYSDPLRTTSGSLASRVHSACTVRRQLSSMGLQSPPFVALQAATANTLGGWLSRSWLSGLVLPGETASHLLMGTVLENDDFAL